MQMFKKIAVWFGLLAVFSSGTLTALPAQAQTGDLFFGQDHSYSVIFRGNGEAVVYGKIDFTNTSDSPVKTFSLEIPEVKPSEFMALQSVTQVAMTDNCDTGYYKNGPLCIPNPYYSNGYGYQNPQYINSSTEYQKLKYDVTGTIYNLQLPQEVQPKQKSSFVFAYVASGYVKKSFGVFKFDFPTPQVVSRIKSITVAVDVDSELVLKGKKSNVQYATSALTSSFSNAMVADSSMQKFASPELSNAIGMIGSGGPIQKSAQNLASNESLNVTGEYATSKWAMAWFGITWKVVLALLIIIALIWLIRKWYKRSVSAAVNTAPQTADSSSLSAQETSFHLFHPLYSSVGIGSVVITFAVTYFLYWVVATGVSGYVNPFVSIILLLILGLFILTTAALPPVLIGVHFGWRAGVSVLANYLLALFVLLLLYVALGISGMWPVLEPSYYRTYPVSY